MTQPLQSPPFRDAFFDESSQNDHRYLVIGTIIVAQASVSALEHAILNDRKPDLDEKSEMKWTKVSRTKLSAYLRVVDAFFNSPLRNLAHFHSLVVDTTQQRHGVFNQGSREIGFSKEIYQLAMKLGRHYSGDLFHLYLDERDTDQSPEKVRTMLNFGIRKKGDKRDWPYRRMQFRPSHKAPVIQLVDVFAGAIAFRLNGHYSVPGASPAKRQLCDYVLQCAGISDASRDTSRMGKFTIWHRKLR